MSCMAPPEQLPTPALAPQWPPHAPARGPASHCPTLLIRNPMRKKLFGLSGPVRRRRLTISSAKLQRPWKLERLNPFTWPERTQAWPPRRIQARRQCNCMRNCVTTALPNRKQQEFPTLRPREEGRGPQGGKSPAYEEWMVADLRVKAKDRGLDRGLKGNSRQCKAPQGQLQAVQGTARHC